MNVKKKLKENLGMFLGGGEGLLWVKGGVFVFRSIWESLEWVWFWVGYVSRRGKERGDLGD